MADKNFEAPAYTAAGASRDRVALPGELFDGTVHMPAMHQAVKAYLANQRQGTAKTKTRSYVAGGNQKPWKQKGTGRARQGSIRAPNWVGGGTVFGPIPRSYAQYVPRQVRALARKSALNARARENAIVIVDVFDFDAPKTKTMQALLEKVGAGDRKVLVLTNGAKPNVFLSGRNLPRVHVMPYRDVSTYHILWSDLVVIEQGALTGEDSGDGASDAEQRSEATGDRPQATGRTKSAKAPKAAARKPATRKAPKAEKKSAKSEKPAAKKAAKKKGK
ncbi:MAG TPA: 50S ribosomal protein L4 [Gemmatimonadaceae bacterium]|nr:50S ribosomal protein L4 [Gemmatimonadaceae bacterium]